MFVCDWRTCGLVYVRDGEGAARKELTDENAARFDNVGERDTKREEKRREGVCARR